MSVKFCPIASGSSGNSIYTASDNTHILIDAGLTGKKIEEGLEKLNVSGKIIDAVFITHEHIDHIKGAGIFSRKYDVPIYATKGTWSVMENIIGTVADKNKKYISSDKNCIINDICIKPFKIPHDAAEPVGYSIFAEDFKVTVATDLGHITDTIKQNVYNSDILLLEANHDIDMLLKGSYPYSLKERILGENGHLSNDMAGNLICDVFNEKLKYIYLGHLSCENNIPHLAYETVCNILDSKNIHLGKELKMDLATRFSVSKSIELF